MSNDSRTNQMSLFILRKDKSLSRRLVCDPRDFTVTTHVQTLHGHSSRLGRPDRANGSLALGHCDHPTPYSAPVTAFETAEDLFRVASP